MAVYDAVVSTYTNGNTISASLFNTEFTALVNVFHKDTGHTHSNLAGDGGPITALRGHALTFGVGTSASDIVITFDGESNDGVFSWMEDEDYFQFSDDVLLTTTEKLQFRDTAIYINSSTDGQLDIVADTEVQIAATTVDINGNVDISGTLTVASDIDFGDRAITNVGSIALDSISGDEDSNTSITFSGSDVITIATGGSTRAVINSSGIDVTGEVKGDTLDIDGNAAITGTVTIDPPLVTDATSGLGAKGIIMKQGDLRMKVDGDFDSSESENNKGTQLQNASRIIFDSEQHEHFQHETLGFRNPAFVIQASYDHSAGYGSGGAGTEFLNANISQLGNGDLTISSGKLQLRGKVNHDDGGDGDAVSGDDFFDHDSFMGITIDGSTTQGTVTRMHYGFVNQNDRNIRLEPSVSGIIVGGDGDATGTGTTNRTDPATIGVNADIDLITLDSNQVTVAGELEATTLDINGAASIAGAVTDVTTLTASSDIEVTDKTKGIILASPNGSRFRLEVANDGTLSTEAL